MCFLRFVDVCSLGLSFVLLIHGVRFLMSAVAFMIIVLIILLIIPVITLLIIRTFVYTYFISFLTVFML